MTNDFIESVRKEVSRKIRIIQEGDEAVVKSRLAKLRHGIGLIPGEQPELWGMIFDGLPEQMLGKYGSPSKEEWAIYSALTLYALHQQGHDIHTQNMNIGKQSLGMAASKLVYAQGGTEDDRERVSRRFNQIALANDIDALVYYIRTFIPLLSANDIGLDYPMLAQDIYMFQTTTGKSKVKLKWGQDYYIFINDEMEE